MQLPVNERLTRAVKAADALSKGRRVLGPSRAGARRGTAQYSLRRYLERALFTARRVLKYYSDPPIMDMVSCEQCAVLLIDFLTAHKHAHRCYLRSCAQRPVMR
eukprot:2419238-Pleurochrysis_carterae.AAC.3